MYEKETLDNVRGILIARAKTGASFQDIFCEFSIEVMPKRDFNEIFIFKNFM